MIRFPTDSPVEAYSFSHHQQRLLQRTIDGQRAATARPFPLWRLRSGRRATRGSNVRNRPRTMITQHHLRLRQSCDPPKILPLCALFATLARIELGAPHRLSDRRRRSPPSPPRPAATGQSPSRIASFYGNRLEEHPGEGPSGGERGRQFFGAIGPSHSAWNDLSLIASLNTHIA